MIFLCHVEKFATQSLMGRLEAKLGGEAKGVVRESVVIKVAESEDTRIERKKKV